LSFMGYLPYASPQIPYFATCLREYEGQKQKAMGLHRSKMHVAFGNEWGWHILIRMTISYLLQFNKMRKY
jgi:hypothetical protein